MIPYLARLLDMTMNNGTLPAEWTSHSGSVHKGGDRSLVTNCRPVSLTSVVCSKWNRL